MSSSLDQSVFQACPFDKMARGRRMGGFTKGPLWVETSGKQHQSPFVHHLDHILQEWNNTRLLFVRKKKAHVF